MFNKLLFNRNAYDRSIDLPSLSSIILSSGSIKLKIVAVFSLTIKPITANGSMVCGLVMMQNMNIKLNGASIIQMDDFLLALKMKLNQMSGIGYIEPKINIRSPLKVSISGIGDTKIDNRLRLIQYMEGIIKSVGNITPDLVMRMSMFVDFDGSSDMSEEIILTLPLISLQAGKGDTSLRRLSELNENILELSNINLLPGEMVTIDTGLLQVLFGMLEDVSSVTSDSIFFELSPGENEILISTDSDSELDVVAIWQNRWL